MKIKVLSFICTLNWFPTVIPQHSSFIYGRSCLYIMACSPTCGHIYICFGPTLTSLFQFQTLTFIHHFQAVSYRWNWNLGFSWALMLERYIVVRRCWWYTLHNLSIYAAMLILWLSYVLARDLTCCRSDHAALRLHQECRNSVHTSLDAQGGCCTRRSFCI